MVRGKFNCWQWPIAAGCVVAVLATGEVSWSQTGAVAAGTTSSASATRPTTELAGGMLDFGAEGLVFPPPRIVNGHTARTAELIAEAYRAREPLVWKRVQLIADLGRAGQPSALPCLIEAMSDPAAAVRAEAARSAALIGGDASVQTTIEKLLGDSDPVVRREAVLASAALARSGQRSTPAVERGLNDAQPEVVAAAIDAAWLPEHATLIAARLASLPQDLRAQAAVALGRLKASEQSAAVIPLLSSAEVPQRAAALRALGEMGNRSRADAVVHALADPHPAVRREAVIALGALAEQAARQANAIHMLGDGDPTVRQAAAEVLTPDPSTDALAALVGQLNEPYAPLHQSVRAALAHPATPAVREATIARAAEMIADANPRRREDASYILGRLRSDAALESHIALLRWDPHKPANDDWRVVGQAAESLGQIGNPRAAELLMALIKPAPDALSSLQRPQRDHMSLAMANALVAAARLRHRPALAEALRILQIDPANSPPPLRSAAAFAVGMLAEPGKAPPADANLFGIYESVYEARTTKFEALKAFGNLRASSAAERLRTIAESDPSPDLRWIAHWACQRCSGTQVPYTPPTEQREPPVAISDLSR